MASEVISCRAAWPTFADGRRAKNEEDFLLVDERIDALDRDHLEAMAEQWSGDTLASYGADHVGSPDLDADDDDEAWARVGGDELKARLKAAVRELVDPRMRNLDFEFDGVRWWVTGSGYGSDGNYVYDSVVQLAESGAGEAPLDGEEFLDVAAVAAAVAVLDDLAAVALSAVDTAGVPAEARAAAAAALDAARDRVLPVGQLIRRTLDTVTADRQSAARSG